MQRDDFQRFGAERTIEECLSRDFVLVYSRYKWYQNGHEKLLIRMVVVSTAPDGK